MKTETQIAEDAQFKRIMIQVLFYGAAIIGIIYFGKFDFFEFMVFAFLYTFDRRLAKLENRK